MKKWTVWSVALAALAAVVAIVASVPAGAQTVAAQTVSACGTPNNTPVVGNSYPMTQDTTGKLCTSAAGGGGGGGTSSNFGSAFPTAGTAIGVKNGANMVNLTADGSSNLNVNVNNSLPAGSNQIGHVIADTGSTTAVTGTVTVSGTVSGTGSAGTPATGVVTVQGITSGTAVTVSGSVTPAPLATAGMSTSSALVANNTTSVAIDANPGTLYALRVFNNSGTIAYLKLYNAAQGSTTCGSGTPVMRIMIPANTSGSGAVINVGGGMGVAFSTAITRCVTTGIADADATAPAASTYIVEADYK